MAAPTESIRRQIVKAINDEVVSDSPDLERERLKLKYGKVWDTKEVQEDFEISGFMAPFVSCTRRKDGKKGALAFQHLPRFYFSFTSL